MTITESFDLYLKDKNVYCADKSVEYYENMMHVFELFLQEEKLEETGQIGSNTLKDYVMYLRNKNIKNTSIHTYMRAVKNYCNWGICNGILIPFDYHIKLPREDPDLHLPLSTTEVNDILTYIKTTEKPDQTELLFRLMLDCGMRSSEALSLRSVDVDKKKGIIKINQSKYEKSRMLPLPGHVSDLIPDAPGNIFNLSESGKQSLFARMQKHTGIKRLHAHLLRHTFATSYMMQVGNLEYLRMYMGHGSYDVTKNYIQSAYQCNLLKYDIYKIDPIFT